MMESAMSQRVGRNDFDSRVECVDNAQDARAAPAPEGAAAHAASPRLVTRGESEETRPNAFVDWLSFTVSEEHFPRALDWVEALANYLQVPELLHADPERGVAGFKHSATLLVFREGEAVTVGKVAWGGDSQRGRVYLSLSGSLCARVEDWEPLAIVLSLCSARITRVDLAHDDLAGVRSVDQAARWYDEGRFNAGGRSPTCSFQGDWKQVSGSGRTFYVGRKAHGKLLRVYEKGKQLGDPTSPWVRWEVEFHNRDRWIPYEVLTQPGPFLAGAFPVLSCVSEVQLPMRTVRKAVSASLEHLVRYLSQSYGKTINALRLQGLDAEDILAQVIRPGLPSRLKHVVAACEPGAKLYGDNHGES